MGDKIDVIAEHQSLASLSVSGTNKGSNAFTLNINLIDVAVSGLLKIWGGEGRTILEDVRVGAMDVQMLAGSVDIITSQTPGKMWIVSESQSVCLVGAGLPSLTPRAVLSQTASRPLYLYEGDYACAAPPCPLYNITSRGRGSVGVHVRGAQPKIYAGAAFKDGLYTSVDHTPIRKGEATYTYVSLSGLGFMKGNVELLWTTSPIWWSFLGDISVCVPLKYVAKFVS
jgi:hypothetical protein